MIDSLGSYLLRDVAPRWHRLLLTSHPYASALVAVFIASGYWPIDKELLLFKIGDPLLTYNTVVIGFCVTSTAICFSFTKEFAKILAGVKDKNGTSSAYGDLVFVFSWTSFSHMICIFVLVSMYIFLGDFNISKIIHEKFSFTMFFFIFFQMYSILQFFVTIIAVHQVAIIYGKWAEKQK